MKKISIIALFMCLFIPNIVINAWSEYTVGQEVEYNGIGFYVIKNSGVKEGWVTMLKAEPLTVDEVNTYGGVGTENNHVNMYNTSSSDSYYRAAYDSNGYGGMAYYTSVNCGYGEDSNHTNSGCIANYSSSSEKYASSEIKHVVDAWKIAQDPEAIEARLFTVEEVSSLGYEWKSPCDNCGSTWVKTDEVLSWVYSSDYGYWTMSNSSFSSLPYVWSVSSDGSLGQIHAGGYPNYVVRPVIIISKSALGDIDSSKSGDNDKNVTPDKQENKKSETTTKVRVANTYLKTSLIVIMIGFIITVIGIIIFYKRSNKKDSEAI